MTSTSTQLIAGLLRRPSSVDSLHWVAPEVPFRAAQDYAAAEYLYRLRLCSVQIRRSVLMDVLSQRAATTPHPRPAPSLTNVSSTMLLYPVQVTAQLAYMEEPLSPVVESSAVYATSAASLGTHTPSMTYHPHAADTLTFEFADEWMIFSLELCDVPLDATCEVHLWYNDTRVGAATFHVYSVEGELRVGHQHLTLTTTGRSSTPPPFAEVVDAPLAETAALLAEYHRGRFPVVPWLDTLSVRQLEARQALRAGSVLRRAYNHNRNHIINSNSSNKDCEARAAKAEEAEMLLSIYVPTATTAVFFEPAVASVVAEMAPLLVPVGSESTDAGTPLADRACGSSSNYAQCLFPDQYTFFKDYNLSEAKAAITSKSQYFVSESSAPPGPKERHQLATLLRRPPIQLDHTSSGGNVGGAVGVGVSGLNRLEEARLLWKYRHFICKDGRYLLPFMRSVDWANTHSTERRAACALMHQWARPGFADILACLSFYFDHVAPVRQYAVRLLRQESDARLCDVTFQLLQAVRYDSAEGELALLLLDRATGCWELCSTFYTMLTIEVALERRRGATPGKSIENGGSSGNTGVRGGGNPVSAPRSATPDAVFEPLLRRLAIRLTQQSPHFVSRLRQQHAMHRALQQLSKQIQHSALDRLGKASLGNKLIAKRSCGLHGLFDTLLRRAPHKSSAARMESSNGGFASDIASQQQVRSPSYASHAAQQEAEEEEEDAEDEDAAAAAEEEDGGGSNTAVTNTEGSSAAAATVTGISTRGRGGHPRRSGPLAQQRCASASAVSTVDVLDRAGVVTLPIYPAIPITGVLANSLYLFKSAKMPMRLTFKALRRSVTSASAHVFPPFSAASAASVACLPTPLAMQQQQQHSASPQLGTSASAGANNINSGSNAAASSFVEDPVGSVEEDAVPLVMMYKYDDDVRQDQLIVQLIRVMDDLLQQDGLQLYLSPYRVIATGPNEGLVEVVPQVTTFLSVQREVLKYLRVYNPTAELLRQAMDRYTRSFAGYCVITFVLGIGDRHLENILLTQDGRLLHIDFGYVLGNDPKPFPPPMKINREMVEVLGGPQSTGFTEFKLYCCSAYNILRKHASLLLHMLLLGAHAESMPQITGEGADPRVGLLKVQEKLRLDLTNAQATQYLQNVIADSVGSIFTNLWDVLHAAAQATRS
jgi:phosphatidylinositol 3-kinase